MGTRLGKFRLIALLATGGMSEIFLARQSGLGGFEKLLVIKRLLPNLAREKSFVQMFLDEARLAAFLNHRNVVQVYTVGKSRGQYYMAMEFLQGESLHKVLRVSRATRARIPPDLAAAVISHAAEGLHYAHTARGPDGADLSVVHRDVSPQNIFILYDGGVKLVDFGIAKAALRNTKTQTGTLKGKFAYMSPEQILGDELDARSDVFSLGIVLWECLTGRMLYHQEGHLQLLESIVREDAVSPNRVNVEIPKRLAEINLKALARDRAKRYQTSDAFRADLADYLNSTSTATDSAAISRHFTGLLSERIQAKRSLIELALEASSELKDQQVADLSSFLTAERELEVPDTGALLRNTVFLQPSAQREWWRRPALWLSASAAVAVAAASGFLISSWTEEQKQTPEVVTTPPGPAEPVKPVEPVEPEQPDEEPVAGTAVASEPARARRKPTRRKRPKSRSRARGRLRLITVPWADIYYKGKKIGQTPLVDVELPAGDIKLRAVNRDEGINRTITVTIKPGERVTERMNFRRGTTSVPLP